MDNCAIDSESVTARVSLPRGDVWTKVIDLRKHRLYSQVRVLTVSKAYAVRNVDRWADHAKYASTAKCIDRISNYCDYPCELHRLFTPTEW